MGAKPPDVTLPTVLAPMAISAPSRAIALPFGQQADALARRALGDLLLDDGGAREASLRAALLADAPQQARFDRRRGGVDVVAVEAEASFEAQRIARAEPDRLDLRLGQKLAGDARRWRRRVWKSRSRRRRCSPSA